MTPALYEEHEVPAHLVQTIAALWQIRGTATDPRVLRVLPDGCADVVVDLAKWRRTGGECTSLVGPMTHALLVPSSHDMDMIGIRFAPGMIRKFIAVSAREIQDAVLPLGQTGANFPVRCHQLCDVESFRDRTTFLLQCFPTSLSTCHADNLVVRDAIHRWVAAARAARSLPSVTAVARLVGVSERRFERLFETWVGYTPAQFRRLVRFRAAVRTAQMAPQSWVDVAVRCGYSDQSHLNRDFRDFAQTTPTGWAEEQGSVGFVQDGRVTAV